MKNFACESAMQVKMTTHSQPGQCRNDTFSCNNPVGTSSTRAQITNIRDLEYHHTKCHNNRGIPVLKHRYLSCL